MTLQEKFDIILDYEVRQQQARKFINEGTVIRDIYNRIVQYFGTQQIGEIFMDSVHPFTELETIIRNELVSLINY